MNLETLERSENVMKVWWQSRRHYDPAKARKAKGDPIPDESANDHAGYSRFADEEGNDRDSTSMEVFWNDADGPYSLRGATCEACEGSGMGESPSDECEACEGYGDPRLESGWYWWACHPGCIADGEPCGPFATSKEAYMDGRN